LQQVSGILEDAGGILTCRCNLEAPSLYGRQVQQVLQQGPHTLAGALDCLGLQAKPLRGFAGVVGKQALDQRCLHHDDRHRIA
jgi:hypothetical protein